MQGDTRPEMSINDKRQRFERMSIEQFRQTAIAEQPAKREIPAAKPQETAYSKPPVVEPKPTPTPAARSFSAGFTPAPQKPYVLSDSSVEVFKKNYISEEPKKEKTVAPAAPERVEEKAAEPPKVEKSLADIKYFGEAFSTYIVAQMDDAIYLIDKHAAHERLIFEELKATQTPQKQVLLASVAVTLSGDEYTAIVENISLLEKFGFEAEDFGSGSVLITAVPAVLSDCDIRSVISEIAESLITTGRVEVERLDDIYHIVACRSAVKAGNLSAAYDLEQLARRILADKDIMYCPHGRPVAMRLTKREIEKQFGRIQ